MTNKNDVPERIWIPALLDFKYYFEKRGCVPIYKKQGTSFDVNNNKFDDIEYVLKSKADKRLNHCIKANKTILQELIDSSKQKEQALRDRIEALEERLDG